MLNKDVPLEAAVKYIVRERDALRKKLDILVPYTKSLEQQVKEVRDETVDRLTKENKGLQKQYDTVNAEAVALRKGYKKSQWYLQLKESNKRLREEIKLLKQTRANLGAELVRVKKRADLSMEDIRTIIGIADDLLARAKKDGKKAIEVFPTEDSYYQAVLEEFKKQKQ